MKLQVKQIHVISKVYTEDGTYTYNTEIIPVNQIMTERELKQLQKQTAIDKGVKMNMVGGIYETFE